MDYYLSFGAKSSNFDNKIRFSIDARMILKKKISKNPIQSATGKKYFNITRV